MAMTGAAADRVAGTKTIPNVVVSDATPGGTAAAVVASRDGASVLPLEPTRVIQCQHPDGTITFLAQPPHPDLRPSLLLQVTTP